MSTLFLILASCVPPQRTPSPFSFFVAKMSRSSSTSSAAAAEVLSTTSSYIDRVIGVEEISESGAAERRTRTPSPARGEDIAVSAPRESRPEYRQPAAVPEPEEVDEKTKERELRRRTWEGTADINASYFTAVSKDMPLDKMSFDLRLEFGQTRPLSNSHAVELAESLKQRPPLTPLSVTVWENLDERRYYVVGGQHLCRALTMIRDERMKAGLPVERWMNTVSCDILRFDTPLSKRRLVAGALNASGKLHRSASIADALRLIRRQDPSQPMDQTERIITAVEHCGLNTGVTPVCSSNPSVSIHSELPKNLRRARRK